MEEARWEGHLLGPCRELRSIKGALGLLYIQASLCIHRDRTLLLPQIPETADSSEPYKTRFTNSPQSCK